MHFFLDVIQTLKDWLQYLKPEYLLHSFGAIAWIAVVFMIFVETGFFIGFFFLFYSLLFFIYNLIGAIVWVGSITTIGYLLGNIKWVNDNLEYIVLALIAVTIIPVIRTYLKEKNRMDEKKGPDLPA